MLVIVKIILLTVAGIAAGHWLGKSSIDSLVDANVKGFLRFVIVAAVCLVGMIVFLIADKTLRLGWAIGTVGLIGGFVFGFFYYPFVVPNHGLHVDWNDKVGTVETDLVFDETRPETGYDLYLPAQKSETGKYALILYIHGGGFTSGDKKAGAPWCKYLTAKGYVTATMNYTLQKPEQLSSLHLMAQQTLACVGAIKDACEKRGYPVTEMAVAGGSAGSTIAMLFAYGLKDQSPIPVKFVFEQTGPVLFDPIAWGAYNYDYAAQVRFISNFSGETVTEEMIRKGEHLPLVRDMSPALLVNETTVPTLCAYGPRDKMVPANLKFELFRAFERHHVPYDYVEYPHSNHGLYDDPRTQEQFLKKLDEYLEWYFENR